MKIYIVCQRDEHAHITLLHGIYDSLMSAREGFLDNLRDGPYNFRKYETEGEEPQDKPWLLYRAEWQGDYGTYDLRLECHRIKS